MTQNKLFKCILNPQSDKNLVQKLDIVATWII